MYFSRSFSACDISDVDVIEHENRLHLFYHSLPSCDLVAHLVSDDGISWTELPYVLRVGEPGEFDDDMIWTAHVFKWKSKFYMLYTALKQSENGLIQRAGLAVSDDLMTWQKTAHNPVSSADACWYETGTGDSGREDWRDPFGWVEGEEIHAVIAAHEKDGPQNRRGCVGHFVSNDAINWEVRPPFYAPRTNSDFEVPTILKLGERYYLLGHIVAPPIDVYRVADSLSGPWRRPKHDWLLPPKNHAFTPVVWNEKTLLFNWISADFDWPISRRIVGLSNDTRCIAPPKEAIALENGELALRSCDWIWDAMAQSKSTLSLSEMLQNVFRGDWKMESETLRADCETGIGIASWPQEYSDFRFEIDLVFDDACEMGIFWRADALADEATQIALLPGRQRIELQRVTINPINDSKRIGRGFSVLQENFCEIKSGETLHLKIIAFGPYIEVSVNDRVLLCDLTMSRRAGRIGMFVADGKGAFENPRLAVLPPPNSMPS